MHPQWPHRSTVSASRFNMNSKLQINVPNIAKFIHRLRLEEHKNSMASDTLQVFIFLVTVDRSRRTASATATDLQLEAGFILKNLLELISNYIWIPQFLLSAWVNRL